MLKPTIRATLIVALGAAGVLGATFLTSGEDNQIGFPQVSGLDLANVAAISDSFSNVESGCPASENTENTRREAHELSTAASVRLGGVFVDATGEPIKRARIFVIPADAAVLQPLLAGETLSYETVVGAGHRCLTGDDGRFVIDAEPATSFVVVGISASSGPAFTLAAPTSGEARLVARTAHSIRGHVVNRKNAPLAGATLTAMHSRSHPKASRDLAELIAWSAFHSTAFSDEAGAFELPGLDSGPFTIVVAHPEYGVVKSLNVTPDGNSIVFELDDAGFLSGSVYDEKKNPIEGAAIAVARMVSDSAEPQEGADFTTDESGRFHSSNVVCNGTALVLQVSARGRATSRLVLPPLRAGQHLEQSFVLFPAHSMRVCVVDEQNSPISGALVEAYDTQSQAFLGTRTTDAEGAVIFENAADERFYRVFAGAQGFSLGTLVSVSPRQTARLVLQNSATYRGVVVDRANRSVLNASVELRTAPDSEEVSQLAQRVNTNEKGEFSLVELEPGPYVIVIAAEGFAVQTRPVEIARRPANNQPDRFELVAGATWTGRIVDTAGNALRDVVVSIPDLAPGSGRIRGSLGPATKTNSNGFFKITNVPDGTTRLLLSHGTSSPRSIAIRSLPSGQPTVHMNEIVWAPGRRLVGFVTGPDGRASEEHEVLLRSDRISGAASPRTRTNASGSFEFNDVAPGLYAVDVMDALGTAKGVSRRITATVLVQCDSDAFVYVNQQGAPLVEGRVRMRNAAVHSDVEVALCSVGDQAGDRTATTVDWSGSFSLRAPGPGVYSLEVRTLSGPPVRTSRILTLQSNEMRIVDLDFGEGALVGFVRTDNAEVMVANARVEIETEAGARLVVPTDASGKFTAEGLPTGTLRVAAYAAGYYKSSPRSISITPGSAAEVEIKLVRGARVAIQVTDPAGEPLTHAPVSLWTSRGAFSAVQTTDGNGGAVFDGLEADTYSAIVEHPTCEGFTSDIAVNQAESTSTTLRTKRVGSLSVVVPGLAGAAKNVDVWVTTSTGLTRRVVCNTSGNADFQSVAEGKITIEVEGAPPVATEITAGKNAVITIAPN